MNLATFAAGCFWGVEATFAKLQGVADTTVGYCGGTLKNPTYRDVCRGDTGHAEVIQITFSPGVITYRDLLTVFFHSHDPTTLNEQGPDKGTQYRSAVLYHSDQQKVTAEAVMKELQDDGLWGKPFVTELAPFDTFYIAEEYHRNYYQRNPDKGYCRAIISPKLIKMRQVFAARLKEPQDGE